MNKINELISLRKLESINTPTGALFENYTLKGSLMEDIKVGNVIRIARTERNGVVCDGWFKSTEIVKIDGDIIETQNSKWKIENILSDRYEKFKKIEKKDDVTSDFYFSSYELSEMLRDIVRNSFGNGPFRISDRANNENLLKLIAEFEFFYILMAHLRLSLSPTIGSGSQSDNRKLWKKMNTKINKIIENENKLDKENE